MATHLILGAGGGVAKSLCTTLVGAAQKVVLFSRSGTTAPGASSVRGDVLDASAVQQAMLHADVAYLLVGLPYKCKVWERDWPRVMANCLNAAEASGCSLVFLDNVYAYGSVKGIMTETTIYHPTSRKGKVRAQIVAMMQSYMATGRIRGLIARSADFYGPGSEKSSMASVLVFNRLADGKKAQAFITDKFVHSYTYVPDIGPALYKLASHAPAWGQVWHLPTAQPALTTRQFADLAADVMGRPRGVQVISRLVLKMMALVSPLLCELSEMLYQNDQPYIFSSTKFEQAIGMLPTSYKEGIRQTAATYGSVKDPSYALQAF